MKLSIVIPCYNCEKTIGRLLDSILENELEKEDYEVIIVNDRSTDNFLNIVKQYETKINFIYCNTVRKVHCPGNTRQVGLSYVSGEWFTFIDNDDMFEPDFFANMFSYIDNHPEARYTLCSNFRAWDDETKEYTRDFIGDQTDTWLHGKFFNTENTLKKFKCYFKDDLMSHEDVYFNSCNLAHLISIGEDYIYLPFFGYKWVYRPDSLSRSYFNQKDYYIDTYLEDFMIGASYPFFDMYKEATTEENKDFALNQIMMTILHGYFYYEASIWRLGTNGALLSSHNALASLKRKIVDELGLSDFDIINYIYNLPERYMKVKSSCFNGTCNFVETQSFRDFILNL